MSKYGANLPAVLNPVGDTCVQVFIPNHPDYIKLFVRAIRMLEVQRNYARDETMTGAKIVTEQWRDRTITPLIEALANSTGSCGVDGECLAYPPFASFISYHPQNPYTEPDLIPEGFEQPPFYINGKDPAHDLPNYDNGDVILDFGSINIEPSWDLAKTPRIELCLEGSGVAEIHFLNIVQGGAAIVSLDNPVDLGDIIAGLIGDGIDSIDLNQDIISLPPETAQEIIFETDTVGAGLHTIYIVFLPILDDSLLPLRFGGGFRGVQLCDFVEQPDVGISNIRFDEASCELQILVEGEWEIVPGWENWLDCVPSGGGGGAGGGALATTHKQDLGAATVTSTATSAAAVTGSSFNHTFTKSKAIVICHAYVQHSGASAVCQIRCNVASATYDDNSYQQWIGTNLRVLAMANQFSAISAGVHAISLTWFTSGGTMTMNNSSLPQFIILEFDDASELFVQDIRIVDGELQKKIAGAWIPVTESLADLLDAIAAAAAAAQVDANTALTQNIAQQTQINTAVTVNNLQNTRLDVIENNIDDIDLSIAGINAAIVPLTIGGTWYHEFDFLVDDWGWNMTAGMVYASGDGFLKPSGVTSGALSLPSKIIIDGRVQMCSMWIRNAGGGLSDMTWNITPDNDNCNYRLSGSALLNQEWCKSPDAAAPYAPSVAFANAPSGVPFYIVKLIFMGRGSFDPFS